MTFKKAFAKSTFYFGMLVALLVAVSFIGLVIYSKSLSKREFQLGIYSKFMDSNLDANYAVKYGDKLQWTLDDMTLVVLRDDAKIETVKNPLDSDERTFLGWSLSNSDIDYEDWTVTIDDNINIYAVWGV